MDKTKRDSLTTIVRLNEQFKKAFETMNDLYIDHGNKADG